MIIALQESSEVLMEVGLRLENGLLSEMMATDSKKPQPLMSEVFDSLPERDAAKWFRIRRLVETSGSMWIQFTANLDSVNPRGTSTRWVVAVPPKAGRPRVLVLGTGWASASFLQALTPEQAQLYDITVISMRNFFLYTPLWKLLLEVGLTFDWVQAEAALPTMSPEDRDALLNFIIVGGGPTGVEIAADLADFVTINLVNMEDHLLSTYSRDISEKSLEVFKAKGVKVLNGWRVTEITEDVVKMTTKQGDYKEIPHGCVIWAAGVKPTSLTQQVKADLQGLNKGSREAELQAKEADVENTGRLSIHALRDLLRSNSERHPQFEAYAQYLEEAYTDSFLDDTFAEIAQVFGKKDRKEHVVWRQSFGQRVIDRIRPKRREEVHEDFRSVNLLDEESITFESFKALLASIHKTLETFPPTAQVAAQQGSYLADLFGKGCLKGDEESLQKLKEESEPFTYFHKGALAYLGGDHAAFVLWHAEGWVEFLEQHDTMTRGTQWL
eukprot:g24012.t1